MSRLASLFLLTWLGVVAVGAAEAHREIPQPPAQGGRAEMGRYLGDLRKAVSPRASDDRREALVLSTATAQAAMSALQAVPWEHLDLVLAECLRAEKDVGPQQRSSHFITGGIEMEIDMSSAALAKRAAFTRLVFYHLVRATDIPAVARKPIFEKWRELPELVAVVFKRDWYAEGDAFVSRALVKKFEEDVGWWGVAPVWSRYLAKLDTPRASEALEYMLTGTSGQTLLDAYAAAKALPAPKRDLDALVAKGWERYKWVGNRAHDTLPYARIAVAHGVTEALVSLARSVGDPAKAKTEAAERDEQLLRAALEQEFADGRAAADFVLKEAKSLRFNRTTRKYLAGK